MRKYLAIGVMLLFGDFAFASAKVADLPATVRLFAECETNDIFSSSPQGYDLRWNMLRVVSRGANALDVESKLSMDSFRLIVK